MAEGEQREEGPQTPMSPDGNSDTTLPINLGSSGYQPNIQAVDRESLRVTGENVPNNTLDETDEQLEEFVVQMAAEIGGEEALAVPGIFTYVSDEDSEDHLEYQDDQDDTGETEEANTGDQHTINEMEEQTVNGNDPPPENAMPQ